MTAYQSTALPYRANSPAPCVEFKCQIHGRPVLFTVRVSYYPASGRIWYAKARNGGERLYRRPVEQPDDERGAVSVWDANVEGIRRGRRKRRTPPWGPELEERGTPSDTERASGDWRWWRSGSDDDDYDEDIDDDDDNPFFDLERALSVLRWMLPATVIFLPLLLGGPMFLMLAFAVFPLTQKFVGPVLSNLWRRSSKPKQKRRRSAKGKATPISSFDMEEFGMPMWRGFGQSLEGFGDSLMGETGSDTEGWEKLVTGNETNEDSGLKLGGWDLSETNTSSMRKIVKGNQRTRLAKRPRKREVPLFLRLLVALFPFLRSWGGFL